MTKFPINKEKKYILKLMIANSIIFGLLALAALVLLVVLAYVLVNIPLHYEV